MTRAAVEIIALDPGANYEAAEVALWLRLRPRTFSRNLARLRALGFPPPRLQWGRRVWSGAALLDWRDHPQETISGGGNLVQLSPLLAARARQAAAGGRRRPG